MIRVPSRDLWPRKEFLHARELQHKAAKADNEARRQRGEAESILMFPEDGEIICDDCNAEIDTEFIHLVNWGNRAVCNKCFLERWAKDPIEYRELKVDGSLGKIIK